ncbi:MAG: hypothetical protein SP1CHLAM54_15670 [Chlamydiia bacterium]|nr:hypothetical protein [Chlamydiia bacterium]MCH9616457.1 hypothetical protein [Chlamydiia bacterium]MCH9629557.1 hypothetical protein [Chlamydiia bacterium]
MDIEDILEYNLFNPKAFELSLEFMGLDGGEYQKGTLECQTGRLERLRQRSIHP